MFMLSLLLVFYGSHISGNDFWWHVKVGQWVVEHRSVPDHDIFSWVGMMDNIEWTPHEWLSDVIFYLILKAGGELGVFMFSLGSGILMCGLMAWKMRKRLEESMGLTCLFLALFTVQVTMFFYGRPHLFSNFLLFGEMYLLYRFRDHEDFKGIYGVPVIAALWSNLHGGSANLSYILPIVMLAGGLKEFSFGRVESVKFTRRQRITLLCIAAASAGAILINPVGMDVLIYPYKSMNDDFMLSVISEWASPDAKQLGQLLFMFLPVFIIVSGMIFGKKKLKLSDALFMLFFLVLFFRSIRFCIIFCIAGSFFGGAYFIPIKSKDIKKVRDVVIVLGVGGAFVAGALWYFISGLMKSDGNYIDKVLSDEMVSFVKEHPAQRIYNDYDLGEGLIYNDIEVFVDARADLFAQEYLLRDAVGLLYVQKSEAKLNEGQKRVLEPEDIIGKYEFDAFLVGKSRGIYFYLKNDSRFQLVKEDENNAYFITK